MMSLEETISKMQENEIHFELTHVYDAGFIARLGEAQFEGFKMSRTFQTVEDISLWFVWACFQLHHVNLYPGYDVESKILHTKFGYHNASL